MNRNPSNSTSMNNSAIVSNLEYASFNLLLKLFCNDLIFAHFFIVSQLQNPIICSSKLPSNYIILFFISIEVEWKKSCKISLHFCNFVKFQYCSFKKCCLKWNRISSLKISIRSQYTKNKMLTGMSRKHCLQRSWMLQCYIHVMCNYFFKNMTRRS